MELHKNAMENVWLETIRTMAEKEIAYKEDIYRKIAGIKTRQIISICLASTIIIILSSILFMVIKNLNDMSVLINTLSKGFESLNK